MCQIGKSELWWNKLLEAQHQLLGESLHHNDHPMPQHQPVATDYFAGLRLRQFAGCRFYCSICNSHPSRRA